MSLAEFSFKLDLLIQLYDTTTGRFVEPGQAFFFREGKKVQPLSKGGGSYAFINTGREDFQLLVRAQGFEPKTFTVCFEKLDPTYPILEAFLIPSEKFSQGEPLLTLSGNLPGITGIEGVSLINPLASFSSLDERKRIITCLKRTGNRSLDEPSYAIVDTAEMVYETLEIKNIISNLSFKVKTLPEKEFAVSSPIVRIVYGDCDSEGNYMFRVRASSEKLKYLVKITVDGKEQFRVVDFKDPDILNRQEEEENG